MKKGWKIYLWSWVAYFTILIYGFIASSGNNGDSEKYMINFSETPENIEKIMVLHKFRGKNTYVLTTI